MRVPHFSRICGLLLLSLLCLPVMGQIKVISQAPAASLESGGTISGDLAVTGNLSVTGDSPWTPRHLRYYFAQKTIGAGSLTNGGGGATFTFTGTGSELTNASGSFALYTSNATLNLTAGAAGPLGVRTGHYADFVAVVHTNPTAQTALRVTVGLVTGGVTTDYAGATSVATFRFSTTAGDTTHWAAVTKDGTNITAQSTGVAYADNTRYVMRVRTTPTAVYFYINDVLTNTITTTLPATTTDLGPYAGLSTAEAAAKSIGIALIAVETR